jgi:hypothetical protein
MYCYLCTENYAGIFTALCENCHKIRHIQSVYGADRVLEVLQRVLVRASDKQHIKENDELKIEKEKLEQTIVTRSSNKKENKNLTITPHHH